MDVNIGKRPASLTFNKFHRAVRTPPHMRNCVFLPPFVRLFFHFACLCIVCMYDSWTRPTDHPAPINWCTMREIHSYRSSGLVCDFFFLSSLSVECSSVFVVVAGIYCVSYDSDSQQQLPLEDIFDKPNADIGKPLRMPDPAN